MQITVLFLLGYCQKVIPTPSPHRGVSNSVEALAPPVDSVPPAPSPTAPNTNMPQEAATLQESPSPSSRKRTASALLAPPGIINSNSTEQPIGIDAENQINQVNKVARVQDQSVVIDDTLRAVNQEKIAVEQSKKIDGIVKPSPVVSTSGNKVSIENYFSKKQKW